MEAGHSWGALLTKDEVEKVWGWRYPNAPCIKNGRWWWGATEILSNYGCSRLDPEQFSREVLPHPQGGQKKA